MDRRSFTFQALAMGLVGTSSLVARVRSAAASSLPSVSPADYELTVFRSPTCGCCEDWTTHMQAAGFKINDNVSNDMESVKQRYGVSAGLDSCHTALVGGYVIEGHVPAKDVQRLLAEKPAVVGLTAPGMPMGSPGMETDGYAPPYTVFAFTPDGMVSTFAKHDPKHA